MQPNARTRQAVAKQNQRLETLQIEFVDVHAIKPNSYNANRQDDVAFEMLRRSMRENGFTQPIIVHRPTMEIVDGEHRWRAALELGLQQVPVVLTDMTETQRKISTLRHNRARGTENVEAATAVLRDLQRLGAMDWAKGSLLLSEAEITRLIENTSAPEMFAGDGFSEAWIPVPPGAISRNGLLDEADEGRVISRTPAAAAKAADVEERALQATNEGERSELRREARQSPLNLTFHEDEADIVRAALGDRPAVRLLELCRAELAEQGIEV